MKRHLLRASLMAMMLSVSGIIIFVQPPPAAARPLFIAAAGTRCTLPDGSTNGTSAVFPGETHPSCCPANATSSPMACLYGKYINPTINLLAAAVGVIVVIAIVYGAIEYTSSGGDPQRIAAGKKRITEALIGLVAFLLLFSFLKFLVPGGING